MSGLLSRPVVAVASPDDAVATASALEPYLGEFDALVLVHVVEKAGGAPDKASVEQLEERGRTAFDRFRESVDLEGVGAADVDERIVYSTDVVEGIVDTAREADATAIVFAPRNGGTLSRLLSGDVSDRLIRTSHVPVLAMPVPEAEE